jgi:macrolide transport system ATP-binding/permease protein
MLEIKDLTIKYDRMILEDVSISFSRGSVTVIRGLSGIGKSSLLNVLGLIKTPNQECSYYLDNENIDFKNEKKKADFRLRKIGFIFQQNNLDSKSKCYRKHNDSSRINLYLIKVI